MEEMQKDGNPTPKIDEEMEDIIDLSEDSLLGDDSENGIIELSESLETDNDLKADDILELDIEASAVETADQNILDISDPAEQNDTLFLEEPLRDEEAEDILDLGEESEISSASDTSTAISSKPTSESPSDMDELLSLLSDDTPEPAVASPAKTERTATVKDLVADGFELGEALDDEILKEMGAPIALAGIREEAYPAAPEPADSGLEAIEKVSTAQIEAAIERVIERRLGEKIDKLLTTAIEKAVSREIDRLKRLLSDG